MGSYHLTVLGGRAEFLRRGVRGFLQTWPRESLARVTGSRTGRRRRAVPLARHGTGYRTGAHFALLLGGLLRL